MCEWVRRLGRERGGEAVVLEEEGVREEEDEEDEQHRYRVWCSV